MKRKLGMSGLVAALLGAYLAGVWWLATALNLQGRNVWILRGGLALLGVAVAIVALLYLLKKPAPPPAPKDAVVDELQKALVSAEKKLATAKVAPAGALGKLPVVLMLGGAGSTKTSTVVRSGLDVELLVGDVFRDDAVVATRGANVWFGRNTLFVEAGRDIADDANRWRWFMRRLQPARLKGALSSGQQAPRVAVVCYSCEGLTAANAGDAAATAARALRDRLGQLAQEFGIRLPVYVVFSKADRIPGFAEYVQHFTRDEARVVVGATLPLSTRADGASHAERETRRLTDAWSRLFSGLAARRIEVLARETAGERKPAAYEFPREVRKVAPAAVQFLVELCRPTELGLGPVLRGFYLTGVRAVVTGDNAAAIPSLMPAREPQAAVAATSVFRPVAAGAAAPPQPAAAGTRKKPEWVFLSGVFQDVILADAFAMGLTRGGARISALRRTLAAAGIGVAAALAIAFTISFAGNRRLQRSVQRAVTGVSTLPAQTVAMPTGLQLATLDSLRDRVATLSEYQEDTPFWLTWGLYSGEQLYGPARTLYFRHFERLLYDSTRAGLHRAMTRLTAPDATVPYDTAYSLLRTYLLTTDEFRRSTSQLVAPTLTTVWPQSGIADSLTRDLARTQFEFFGGEIRNGNPYPGDVRDAVLVGRARDFLAKSVGIRPIYLSMMAAASRNRNPVRFTGGGGVVINNGVVDAAFTKGGWAFFTDTALGPQLNSFLEGEPWVTGGIAKPPADRDSLARQLRRMYIDDYVKAWQQYVKAGGISGFGSLADAASKVERLASPTSPLLAMLLTASEHTIVDSVFVRMPLQPVDVVMPLKNKDTYVGGANQDYIDQLGGLSSALRQAATVPTGTPRGPQLQAALDASEKVRDAVSKLARQFASAPESVLTLRRLLETPAERAANLIRAEQVRENRAAGALSVNEAAAQFCGEIRDVLDKAPFAQSQTWATAAELTKHFKPGGTISQFYDATLQGKVLTRSGSSFRGLPAGPIPTPQLINFMTAANRITTGLFPGGAAEPRIQVTLKPQLTETLPNVTVSFGDTTMQYVRGGERAVTTVWRFSDNGVTFSRRGMTVNETGPWAPLRMYWNESRSGPTAGTRIYDIVSGASRATLEMSVAGGLGDRTFFTDARSCPTQAVR